MKIFSNFRITQNNPALSASIDILKRPFASFSGLLPANKDCGKSSE
jgi:hypothetical protein